MFFALKIYYSNNPNVNFAIVDWANLAQQWIHMKEIHETVVINNIPAVAAAAAAAAAAANFKFFNEQALAAQMQPPSMMAFTPSDTSYSSNTGGEAPMDVVKDECEETGESSQGN